MALKHCRECKAQISTTAKVCPSCGAPVKKRHSIVGGIFGGVFLVGVLFVVFQKPSVPPAAAPQTPEQQAAAAKVRDQRMEDWSRAKAIKDGMNNPASFKLVKAVRADNGDLCVLFSGTNAFNAAVTNSIRFAGAKSQLVDCMGMPGKDVTSAIEVDLKHGY